MGKEDAYECKFIQNCKEQKDSITNPIYHFTESEIWEYVRRFNVPMNPLYSKGYKRVGCIGCPLAGGDNRSNSLQIIHNTERTMLEPVTALLPIERKQGNQTAIKMVMNGSGGGLVKTLSRLGLKTYLKK